jgi:biopolymer transport protein ExbB/TolQ
VIATAPPQASAPLPAPIAPQAQPIIDLGRGDDLNPRLTRWLSIGGITGFLLWGAATPPAVPLHGFLHQRGPTQVWCLVLSGMVVAFLVMKWRILGREQKKIKAMDRDFAPLLASGDLDALSRRAEQSATLLGKRLLHIVGVWTSTESTFQLERNADADAELYQLAQESSFSLVKVLMWAIPLLGFIGTVIGMGQAVGSFGAVLSNSDNVDGLKAGLTKVTGGLGTAFDTTYLALVLQTFLAFPMNVVESRETELLNAIDADVRGVVMGLSPGGESAGGSGAGPLAGRNGSEPLATSDDAVVTAPLDLKASELGELINAAFEQFLPDPSVLVTPAQQYADQLTNATLEKLTPLTSLVSEAVDGVAEARLSLQDQAQQIRASLDGAAAQLNQSVQDLEPLLRQLQGASALSSVLGENLDQLQATIELRRAIEALNANLAQLQERPRRRLGWLDRLRGRRR